MGERRDSIRVGDSIQLKTITAEGETTFTSGASLSETGVFVEYILPYAEGTHLEVEFQLPGAGIVHARAVVVSAQKYLAPDFSNRLGNGLRFEDLDSDNRERIRDWMRAQIS